jgi:hypothetical protein
MVDPGTGQITREWYRYLEAHWDRTGGPSDDVEGLGILGPPQDTRDPTPDPFSWLADELMAEPEGTAELLALAFMALGHGGGGGDLPRGVIVAWKGTTSDIPAGWALCDGNNGTPNLQDRFIVGAGNSYSGGDTGGSTTADLEHSHGPGTLATDTDATTNSTSEEVQSGTGTTVAADGHDHSHSHSVDSGTTGDALSATQSILPPYYALAWIMKI